MSRAIVHANVITKFGFNEYEIKRHGSVSCQVPRSNERRTVYLYASRPVESTRDYQTSITAERIEFLLGLIDSLGLNYIRKVSLFLLYIFYKHKQRYYDAKSKCGVFILRNVTVVALHVLYTYTTHAKKYSGITLHAYTRTQHMQHANMY